MFQALDLVGSRGDTGEQDMNPDLWDSQVIGRKRHDSLQSPCGEKPHVTGEPGQGLGRGDFYDKQLMGLRNPPFCKGERHSGGGNAEAKAQLDRVVHV